MNIILAAFVLVMFLVTTFISVLNYNNRHGKLPESVKNIYDEEDYEEWHRYFMSKFKFGMIKKTFNTGIVLILLIANSFITFQNAISEFTSNDVFQLLIFIGLLNLLHIIINLPFKYYDTFVIEEKFGLNKTTKITFVTDLFKNLLEDVVLGGLILIGLAKLVGLFNNQLIYFVLSLWIFSALLIVVMNFASKFFTKIINKLSPLEEGSLKDKIKILSDKTGFDVKSIWVMDASKRSTRLNAMLMGFGKNKDIILYDTLIEKMPEEGIISVLAHELGHAANKDTIKGIFDIILKVGLYIVILGLMLFYGNLGLGYTLISLIIIFKPLGILIGIAFNKRSRLAEYKADSYSTLHTDKKHLIDALRVLAKENFENLTPHPLFVKIRYIHPPIYQRIDALNNK